jgi:thymidylate kinase
MPDTRLIAFCGIDGAGKSTLIRMIRERGLLEDVVFVRKELRETTSAVYLYHRRDHEDERDWVTGSYAYSMGLAAAFDFLRNYHDAIRPHLGERRHVVSDRYAICYQAYLLSTGYPLPVDDMFHKVAKPDIIVYVHIPVTVAAERQSARGGASEDESPEVMVRFEAAYRELLPRVGCPVLEIRNDRDVEETYQELSDRLTRILEERQAPSWGG